MNVILLGYRGCGKTSVGKKLAYKLWKEFVDADARPRDRFDGRTVAEIWETEGEAAWREAETEVVKELVQLKDHVIGLGGGSLMHEAAREAVIAAPDATRIYLQCDPKVLASRIDSDMANAAQRPSLTGGDSAADEVEAVLAERDPIYREVADIVFNCTFTDVEQTTAYLVGKL